MEEKMDNKLLITVEDGSKAVINVLDIIDSYAYNKTFMIYTFENENKTVFASILNEDTYSYSLDTITNQDEINYINNEIDRVVNEIVGASA
ncbi:MAG: hypothetical protein IKR57_02570 [Bacilli bacterium]|nr:hypothetical protein [Bacilli bacterium]